MKILLSIFVLSTALLLPINLYAVDISINSGLLCKINEGSNPQIYSIIRGKPRVTSFSLTLKKTADAAKKAREKLAQAKSQGRRRAITNARLALAKILEVQKAVKACKKGTLAPVIDVTPAPTQVPTPVPTLAPSPAPTVTATPTATPGGTNTITYLRADSELQLSIDPSLGFSQYFGYIYFTDVTSLAPAFGLVVPEALQIATRAACLDAWDNEPNKAVRILTRRLATGIIVSLNPPGFWVPGNDGRYTSQGFNAEPAAEVTAIAGFFWDISYSQRVILKTIAFEYEGQILAADCFVGPQVTVIYP